MNKAVKAVVQGVLYAWSLCETGLNIYTVYVLDPDTLKIIDHQEFKGVEGWQEARRVAQDLRNSNYMVTTNF